MSPTLARRGLNPCAENHMLGLACNLCDAPGLGLTFPFTNGGVVYSF
jgi:hypothetical protein